MEYILYIFNILRSSYNEMTDSYYINKWLNQRLKTGGGDGGDDDDRTWDWQR